MARIAGVYGLLAGMASHTAMALAAQEIMRAHPPRPNPVKKRETYRSKQSDTMNDGRTRQQLRAARRAELKRQTRVFTKPKGYQSW